MPNVLNMWKKYLMPKLIMLVSEAFDKIKQDFLSEISEQ